MKLVALRPDQFDNFATKHKYKCYLQTSAYISIMQKFGYRVSYIGFVNNGNLIGATGIIFKEVFMKYKFAFAPRGILIDYDNSVIIKDLAECLKQTLGKQKFIMLRMDPYLPISIRDNTGEIINLNNQEQIILSNLKAAGFKYKGKNLFFETENPRWEALILLNKHPEDIYNNFNKQTRNKIRKAINAGIIVKRDETKNFQKLYEYIKKKEKKPLSFYQGLINSFKDNCELYYGKINTEVFVQKSKELYEKETQNNEQLAINIQSIPSNTKEKNLILNKKMASDKALSSYKENLLIATELLKKYPTGITISGCLVIIYDNAAYIYTEGYNEKYANLSANYLIKWYLINEYHKRGLKYINLNAIVGDFENINNNFRGLNETKLGYNSLATEYIGEFDLILDNFGYKLYEKFNKNK